MTATLDPVKPATVDDCASTHNPATGAHVAGEAVPLESMSWAELKRAAREAGVKLNAKKPVIIRRISEARAAADARERFEHSRWGRLVLRAAVSKRRLVLFWQSCVSYWKRMDEGGTPATVMTASRQWWSKLPKSAIWGSAIVVGGIVGLIAALC